MTCRDECRKLFLDAGLTYDDLDDSDIAALHLMLGDAMRRRRKDPTGSYHKTWRMSSRIVIKHKSNGRLREAYLTCIIYPGSERECVSFNRDGFIGFCGEFDDHNAEPILSTFAEWCRLLGPAHPNTAKRVMTTNPETDGATGRCYCGACGKSIDPSDNFCRGCGARLED